jgi:hypothetical protein
MRYWLDRGLGCDVIALVAFTTAKSGGGSRSSVMDEALELETAPLEVSGLADFSLRKVWGMRPVM